MAEHCWWRPRCAVLQLTSRLQGPTAGKSHYLSACIWHLGQTQLGNRPSIKAFWPITKCYTLVVTRLCRRPLRTWGERSINQRIDFEIHNVNLITEWRHHDGEKLQYSNTDAFSGLLNIFWDGELSCNQLFCFYLIWVDLLKGKPFSGNQCQKKNFINVLWFNAEIKHDKLFRKGTVNTNYSHGNVEGG